MSNQDWKWRSTPTKFHRTMRDAGWDNTGWDEPEESWLYITIMICCAVIFLMALFGVC